MKNNLFYFAFLVAFCIVSSNCFAQSQGPDKPDTVFNTIMPSAMPWKNPVSAKDSNKIYATDSVDGAISRTDYLVATRFNFSIPSNATITGITVRVLGHDTIKSLLSFFEYAALIKNGVIQHDSIQGGGLTAANRWETTGSCSTLWNDSTWRYSDINSPNFGVTYFARLAFLAITGFAVLSIDAIEASVCYSVPTSTETFTQTSFAGNIFPNPSKGRVELNYSGTYLLQVDDLTGKEVYRLTMQRRQNIDLSFLSGGIYFIHITSGSGSFVQKLVIEK